MSDDESASHNARARARERDEQDGCLTSITLLSALQPPAQGALLGCVWRLIKVQIRGVGVVEAAFLREATCLNTMLMGHLPSETREP
jgi:hypothetical protein